METKTVEKTLVAKHSFTTTLSEIMSGKLTQPQKLMGEVAKQGFDVYVPHIWSYIGCDGQLEKTFTLEMCIPVNKKGENTDFITFEELPEIKSVGCTHKGGYCNLGDSYCKLFKEIEKEGIKPSGNCREVYLHCDMNKPENNVTEIQVEII